METTKHASKNGGWKFNMKQIMYIGPDVKGVVGKNQIFTFDPEDKKKEVEKIYAPAVKLFVDIKDITVKRNELRREGSYLELLYRNFEKKLGGNNGGV